MGDGCKGLSGLQGQGGSQEVNKYSCFALALGPLFMLLTVRVQGPLKKSLSVPTVSLALE